MNFFDVLGEMLVILFAIVAGFVSKRLGYLGGETDQKLSKLLLNVTMPAMILASVLTGDELPEVGVILSVLEVGAVFYALSFAVALAVPRFLPGTPAQKGVWRTPSPSPMWAYRLPVAVALFGRGLFTPLSWRCRSMCSLQPGPLMLAGMARFRWEADAQPLHRGLSGRPEIGPERLRPRRWRGDAGLRGLLHRALSCWWWAPSGGYTGGPGVSLAKCGCVRPALLVLPVVLWAILRTMGTDDLVLGIAVTQIAMPVAVNGTLLSMEYGGDTTSMAQITFLTTLGSILTIPLLAALLL
jgi:hypothetical protein